MGVLSLEQICIEVVAAHDYWMVQKRHLQYLPEHAANQLLQLLLWRGGLQQPKQLDIFRHSATQLHISGRHHALGTQQWALWIAYIADLSQLHVLSLIHIPRLKDKHLAPLTRLAGSLTALDLTACSSITRGTCQQVVGQLTNLRSLVLSNTGVRPPFLNHLSQLTGLTHIDVGGCKITDAEITNNITAFKSLQHLVLWGSSAGDASVPYLAQLQHLQQLDMAWCKLRAAVPWFEGLRQLDLSHCTLDASWEEVAAATAAAASMTFTVAESSEQPSRATHIGYSSSPAAYTAATPAAAPAGRDVGLDRLERVVLAHAQLSPSTCEVLEHMLRSSSHSLQYLDLTNVQVHDLLPVLLSLDACTALTALSLSATGLQDDYCPCLAFCTALQALDLSLNPGLTATGLAAVLPVLHNLQRLNLFGCTGVTDSVLPILVQLPRLQHLILAGTAVSWELKLEAAATALTTDNTATDNTSAGSSSEDTGHSTLAARPREPAATEAQSSNAYKHQAKLWPKLQILDVSNTCITYAGCVQLAQQMSGWAKQDPTVEAAPGLCVLLIGSSRLKLGQQALAAVGRISSLQQLTLQRWQLLDNELEALSNLQQLQQLHVLQQDPWLLSDAALLDLAGGSSSTRSSQASAHTAALLPDLWLITRDSRVLLTAADAGSVGTAPSLYAAQQQTAGSGGSWLSEVALAAVQPHTVPYMACDTRAKAKWATGTVSNLSPSSTSAAGPSAPFQGKAEVKLSSSSSRRSSDTSHATVYRRLSEYDERHKYTRQQLMDLQVAGSDAAEQAGQLSGATGLPAEIRADSEGTRWRQA